MIRLIYHFPCVKKGVKKNNIFISFWLEFGKKQFSKDCSFLNSVPGGQQRPTVIVYAEFFFSSKHPLFKFHFPVLFRAQKSWVKRCDSNLFVFLKFCFSSFIASLGLIPFLSLFFHLADRRITRMGGVTSENMHVL